MASKSYSFIVVPDTASRCKRYNISKSRSYILGTGIMICFIVLSVLAYTMFSEYRTMVRKLELLEKLRKVSLSQKSTIDRYEEDVTQLVKNLAHIKELNSRLIVLTGLDPEKGKDNFGLGGSEEGELKTQEKNSESGASQ